METLADAIPRDTDAGVGGELDGGLPMTGFDLEVMAGLLAGFDPSGLDAESLLAVLAGMERVIAAAHAVQVRAMAEFTRHRPATSGRPFGEFVADEIDLVLSVSRRAAENRVAQAVEMTSRTPAVLHALESGVLDLYRAKLITDATYRLGDQAAARVAGRPGHRVGSHRGVEATGHRPDRRVTDRTLPAHLPATSRAR